MEWGVNNPLFKITPTIYLIAQKDVATGGIGGDDKLDNLTSMVIDELRRVGLSNYVIITSKEDLDAYLFKNPPKNAVVINLLGNVTPVLPTVSDPDTIRDEYIAKYSWIWVNIVGKAPITPTGVTVKKDNAINASILPESAGEDMVKVFKLYDLPKNYVSNYTIEYNPNFHAPSYMFYGDPTNSSRALSAGWVIDPTTGGTIIINSLPELDWVGGGANGSNPSIVVEMAVYTALCVWLNKVG